MRVKHEHLRNEPLITRYGELQIDKNGFVTIPEGVEVKPEQLLELPGFMNGDLFSPPEEPKAATTEVTKPVADPLEPYKAVLAEMKVDPKTKRNSEQYVDMDYLLDELKKRGMKPITGGERKRLEDELKNAS